MATTVHVKGKFGRRFPLEWQVQVTLKKIDAMHAPYYILKNKGTRENNFASAMTLKKGRIAGELY